MNETTFGGPTATSQAERNRQLFLTSFAQFASGNPDVQTAGSNHIAPRPGLPSGGRSDNRIWMGVIRSGGGSSCRPGHRSHAPWPPRLPGQYIATASIDEVPELQVRAADVQASLSVLGRGGFAGLAGLADHDPLDLHAVDLRWAHLDDAHLEVPNLEGAPTSRAGWLLDACLEGANLGDAHLEGAHVLDAHPEDASLGGAHLRE